jgi:hypothetical protein
MSNGGPEEYIGLDMAMHRLKLSRRQVYRYAAENRIRVLPTKQGQLYHRGDVEDLAAALKVDERPERVQVDTPRPDRDRATLTREIEELRALRGEIGQLIAEQRQQRLLTDGDRQQAADQQARLDRAIAELEAARAALARPFYAQPLFWLAAVALIVALAAVAVIYFR